MRNGTYLFPCMLFLTLVLGGCASTRHNSQTTEMQADGIVDEEETEIFFESETEDSSVAEPLNYEYKTQELYTRRDENQIYGVVYIPQDAGEKMPTVIFSHGFGGNYQVGTQYAEALAAKGYVVYCFDFCGESPGSRSDGSTLDMSIFTEQADLESVIHMMQEQAFVDEENIFLMGTSQGALYRLLLLPLTKKKSKVQFCCIRLLYWWIVQRNSLRTWKIFRIPII